jgi:hypothetical protein
LPVPITPSFVAENGEFERDRHNGLRRTNVSAPVLSHHRKSLYTANFHNDGAERAEPDHQKAEQRPAQLWSALPPLLVDANASISLHARVLLSNSVGELCD